MSLDALAGPPERLPHLDDVMAGVVHARAGADGRVRPGLRRAPPLVLGLRLGLSVLGAGTVAALLEAPPPVTAVVLLCWAGMHLRPALTALRPGLPDRTTVIRAAVTPFVVVALAVASTGIDPEALAQALGTVAAATALFMLGSPARARTVTPVRLVVVGDRRALGAAAADWARRPGVILVGAVLADGDAANTADSEPLGVPTVRGWGRLDRHVARWGGEVVVVVPGPHLSSVDVQRMSWVLEGTGATLTVHSLLDPVAPHRLSTVSLAGCTLTRIGSSRTPLAVRAAKATTDRVVGTVLLVLVSPLLLGLVLLVRLDSPGPGIYRSTRVGRGGRPFTMLKIRTMCSDADLLRESLVATRPPTGVLFKLVDDPRVTRLGQVLRRTSLDELPQLVNVIRGEMSLVGPRPALAEEVARYDQLALRRLAVRPGMTGLWQVSGRSDLSWERAVELDARYTDNITVADDLALCLRTVRAVVHGRGAY